MVLSSRDFWRVYEQIREAETVDQDRVRDARLIVASMLFDALPPQTASALLLEFTTAHNEFEMAIFSRLPNVENAREKCLHALDKLIAHLNFLN